MSNLEHSHEPAEIRRRLRAGHKPSYLADAILGGIDGCVTTVAVVASVAGTGLPAGIAFVLGVASLVADAFSMAASNFQAVKSEREALGRVRRQENRHIEQEPEGERAEIRIIFENKGFEGEVLEHIVDTITEDRQRWIDVMVQEEYGLPLQGPPSVCFTQPAVASRSDWASSRRSRLASSSLRSRSSWISLLRPARKSLGVT